MNMNILVMYQSSNLCDALIKNVNDNFISVSFDILGNNDVLVKIILESKTQREDDHIDDIMAEMSARQESNCIRNPVVEVGWESIPLKNLVYQRHK